MNAYEISNFGRRKFEEEKDFEKIFFVSKILLIRTYLGELLAHEEQLNTADTTSILPFPSHIPSDGRNPSNALLVVVYPLGNRVCCTISIL